MSLPDHFSFLIVLVYIKSIGFNSESNLLTKLFSYICSVSIYAAFPDMIMFTLRDTDTYYIDGEDEELCGGTIGEAVRSGSSRLPRTFAVTPSRLQSGFLFVLFIIAWLSKILTNVGILYG